MMFLSMSALILIAVVLGFFAPFYLRILGSGFCPRSCCSLAKFFTLFYLLWSSTAWPHSCQVCSAPIKDLLCQLVPIVTPLIAIAAILLAPKPWSAFTLAIGVVAGSILEAAILLRVLNSCGMRFRLHWHGVNADVRSVLLQYAPVLAGSVLMCSTTVVDASHGCHAALRQRCRFELCQQDVG